MKLPTPALILLCGSLMPSPAAANPSATVLGTLDARGRAIAKKPCNSPASTKITKRANQHEPAVIDEIVKLTCAGIEVETYRAHSYKPPVTLPLSVRVTKPNSSLPKSLQVGSSLSRVTQVLGQPSATDNSALTYPLSAERPDQDTISFVHEAGRISSVVWVWSVD